VFDLQKTLPTPHLNMNKVYYMRQLWTYKLAIHDSSSGHAYMHMWDETGFPRISRNCILFVTLLQDTSYYSQPHHCP